MGMQRRLRLVPDSGMETLNPSSEWVEALGAYGAWERSAGHQLSTIHKRNYELRRFAVRTGHRPFLVTLEQLLDFMSDDAWGPSARRAVRGALRSFYGWATLTGRVARNVAEGLPAVPQPRGFPRPAPEPAVQGGLSHVDERIRRMVRLGAQHGLRCCEIAIVHTDDVLLRGEQFHLKVRGKGDKTRIIPLARDLAFDLLGLPRGWVFAGNVDGHLSASYVSKLMSRHLPDGVTAHMLRHRYASRAYNHGGKNIRAVQELLGHASVETTQIYTAVEDDALTQAAAAAAA